MEISRLLLFVPEQPYLYAMPLAGPVRVGRGGTTALSKRSLNYLLNSSDPFPLRVTLFYALTRYFVSDFPAAFLRFIPDPFALRLVN